jgi:alkylhydroperoxidase family enzyme
VPWRELRRRATVVFLWLQAGWGALAEAEREEVRRLVSKSRGRPRNLSRDEAQRLGRIAAKAAGAAARRRKP